MTDTIETVAGRDARIIGLQSELLTHAGQVQVTRGRAYLLVREINALRRANGWRPLSLRGRWAA